MSAMKELAGAGRTVVAVIHQPRSSIFTALDGLVLLSEGRTVYVGPAQDAHAWFVRQGFVCPAGAAPADYFLDVMAKVKVGGRWGLECPEVHASNPIDRSTDWPTYYPPDRPSPKTHTHAHP